MVKAVIALDARTGASDTVHRGRLTGQKWPDRYSGFSRGHAREWYALVFGPEKVHRPGKEVRRTSLSWWRAVEAQGMAGALAAMLNGAQAGEPVGLSKGTPRTPARPKVTLRALKLRTLHPSRTEKVADQLLRVFAHGGWEEVERALLWSPDINPLVSGGRRDKEREAKWHQALTECTVFAPAGFDIGWCDYGQHFYVRGDKRQSDCPLHNKAGEQWRWWWKNVKQREAAQPVRRF